MMSTQILPSVCPLDCPDRCSLDVTVEEGRILRIAGSHRNPVTAGFICNKVARFAERVDGPDRLLHPMRRVGAKGAGRFERISWDAAIDEITTRLVAIRERLGGEAILPLHYSGSNGMLTEGTFDARYFRLLGASRLDRTVCAAPTGLASKALYGKMAGVDFRDYDAAKLIVIWGGNPAASNIHLLPHIKRARKAGAKVVLVDPRRTFDDVDLHVAPWPGTDLVLALALVAELERLGAVDRQFLDAHATGSDSFLAAAREWPVERAASVVRIPADEIRTLAAWYAEADPSLVRCGWGLERNRNADGAVAAVLALPAIAGKFGKRGGGYTMSASGVYRVDTESIIGIPAPETRTINMTRTARALTELADPPIAALFVFNNNPVVTVPDQNRLERGLGREDLFTVVFDQVMTDTAAWGDILLPATTFLEHRELSKSYGCYAVQWADPVIPPRGEALPNEEVFRRLGRAAAKRLGRGGELFEESDEALAERCLRAVGAPMEAGVDLARLRAELHLPLDFPGPRPVQFETVFPMTADRKIDLAPVLLGEDPWRFEPLASEERFPLALLSPASNRTITSTCGEFNLPEARLEINPADAVPRGLADGGPVRVSNELGEVLCRASLSEAIRPGVVALPKGLWRKATRNGRVSGALIPDTVTRASGGACWNDARVEVERG